jgi:hypothetical protein
VVPFLLPFSIGLMIALAIGLVLFLRFYQVPRPARRSSSAELARSRRSCSGVARSSAAPSASTRSI